MVADPPEPQPFSVVGRDGALIVVGELDAATAPVLQAAVSEHLAARADLVVDLTGVTFMDSTGLSALVEAHRESGARPIVLRGASSMIRRLLEITGLDEIFTVEDPRPA